MSDSSRLPRYTRQSASYLSDIETAIALSKSTSDIMSNLNNNKSVNTTSTASSTTTTTTSRSRASSPIPPTSSNATLSGLTLLQSTNTSKVTNTNSNANNSGVANNNTNNANTQNNTIGTQLPNSSPPPPPPQINTNVNNNNAVSSITIDQIMAQFLAMQQQYSSLIQVNNSLITEVKYLRGKVDGNNSNNNNNNVSIDTNTSIPPLSISPSAPSLDNNNNIISSNTASGNQTSSTAAQQSISGVLQKISKIGTDNNSNINSISIVKRVHYSDGYDEIIEPVDATPYNSLNKFFELFYASHPPEYHASLYNKCYNLHTEAGRYHEYYALVYSLGLTASYFHHKLIAGLVIHYILTTESL